MDLKKIESTNDIQKKKMQLFNLAETINKYMKNIDEKFQTSLKNAGYW